MAEVMYDIVHEVQVTECSSYHVPHIQDWVAALSFCQMW